MLFPQRNQSILLQSYCKTFCAIRWQCTELEKPEGKKSVYLNLTEEDFVPDAVTANDPTADLSTFSLRGKVKQPTLEWGVSLAEDL